MPILTAAACGFAPTNSMISTTANRSASAASVSPSRRLVRPTTKESGLRSSSRPNGRETYLGEVGVGDSVNIERALAADSRFDGHVVQGHVDTVTTIEAIEQIGDDWRFRFALPADYAQYIVDKGSICLDGISLTVAELDDAAGSFEVAIIPMTYELTTLQDKTPGDPVHVEVDVIAKYVERMLDGYQPA